LGRRAVRGVAKGRNSSVLHTPCVC
jgi:hypothetical protein